MGLLAEPPRCQVSLPPGGDEALLAVRPQDVAAVPVSRAAWAAFNAAAKAGRPPDVALPAAPEETAQLELARLRYVMQYICNLLRSPCRCCASTSDRAVNC